MPRCDWLKFGAPRSGTPLNDLKIQLRYFLEHGYSHLNKTEGYQVHSRQARDIDVYPFPAGSMLSMLIVPLDIPFTYMFPHVDNPKGFSTTPGQVLDNLAEQLYRFGLNGESCVERLVCELNSKPVKLGLLGDILNTIFMGDIESSSLEYKNAQIAGRYGKSCKKYKQACPVSIFNFQNALENYLP